MLSNAISTSSLIFVLFLTASFAVSDQKPTAYDAVKSYNLPEGILPIGVVDYELNPKTGDFKVYFNDTCEFSIQSYQLKYKSTISGVISTGHVKNLKGVSVKIRIIQMPRLAIVIASFLFLLHLPSPLAVAAEADSPTAYSLLQSYNFPVGILPKGVVAYDLDTSTGKFHAYFNDSCSFSLVGSYQLNYKSTISGYISENKLKNLSGIKVKVLFLWLNIVEVTRNGDEMGFSVGFTSANFAIQEFLESPQCGCGFECKDSESERDLLFAS
ncbi:unnamed protein product [Thlaspi arvense]|uniref:Uncharacterized protein n=1 Tax=Thlaspi arvense TaxID=13288 RepID=A0AAU9SPF1_THLAR|nr:unnamed protein product [Thlaspi arvense]